MVHLLGLALTVALSLPAVTAFDAGLRGTQTPAQEINSPIAKETDAQLEVPDFNPAFSFSLKNGARGGGPGSCTPGWVCDATCIYISLGLWICRADVEVSCPTFHCYSDDAATEQCQ